MSTTIDALRNLGLKVNGEEPTSNYVNNVINEIADNYSPSEAGMSNPMTTAGDIIVGGTSGAPTRLAKGTQGQVLSVGSSGLEWTNASSGGGSGLYKHTIPIEIEMDEEISEIMFEFITTRSTPFVFTSDTLNTVNDELSKCLAEAVRIRVYMVNPDPGYAYYAFSAPCIGQTQTGIATPGQSGHGDIQFQNIAIIDTDSIMTLHALYMDCLSITDTVTAL